MPAPQMIAIDPDSLPFPPAKIVVRREKMVPLGPEVIDGASGQCPELPVRDAEGILFFNSTGIGFLSDSGELHDWPYESITDHKIKRFWLRPGLMRTVAVTAGERRIRFRVGYMLAANADYILRAVRRRASH